VLKRTGEPVLPPDSERRVASDAISGHIAKNTPSQFSVMSQFDLPLQRCFFNNYFDEVWGQLGAEALTSKKLQMRLF
jgi:hypothetical protein